MFHRFNISILSIIVLIGISFGIRGVDAVTTDVLLVDLWTEVNHNIYNLNTGNVGIGDTTPASLLTVGNGDLFQVTSTGNIRGINGTASSPTLSFTADTNTGIYSGGSDILKLSTAGSDRFTVLSSGNVGIGDTSPASLLTVGNRDLFRVQSTGEVRGITGTASSPSFSFTADTNTGFRSGGGDIVHFVTGGSDRMTINSSGNVGIGTTSPAQKLDVAGTVQMTGFKLTSGARTDYVLTSDTSGVGTWQPALSGKGTTDTMVKFTGTTSLGPASIIERSGYVGINTDSPSAKLHVAANDQSTSLLTLEQQSAGLDAGIEFRSPTDLGYRIVHNPTDNSIEIRRVLPSGVTISEAMVAKWGGIAGFAVNAIDSYLDCLITPLCFDFIVGEPREELEYENSLADPGEFVVFDDETSSIAFRNTLSDTETLIGTDEIGSFINVATNHPLAFLTNNTVKMFMDTNGRVGIGETNPEATLHVQDEGSTRPAAFIENTGDTQSDLAWKSNTFFNIGDWDEATNTFTERMMINPLGRIGIGASASNDIDVKLRVEGDIQLLSGVLKYPDGTTQDTADVIGEGSLEGSQGLTGNQGPTGPPGMDGETGEQGPIGPAVTSVAACSTTVSSCTLVCPGGTVTTSVEAPCVVTADTGSCGIPAGFGGYCCVCDPS